MLARLQDSSGRDRLRQINTASAMSPVPISAYSADAETSLQWIGPTESRSLVNWSGTSDVESWIGTPTRCSVNLVRRQLAKELLLARRARDL